MPSGASALLSAMRSVYVTPSSSSASSQSNSTTRRVEALFSGDSRSQVPLASSTSGAGGPPFTAFAL